jgi:hypothetical protein
MNLSLVQSQSLRLEQRVELRQVIQTAQLFSFSDEVLSAVMDTIVSSPDIVEGVLRKHEGKKDDCPIGGQVQSVYSTFGVPSGRPGKGGLITSFHLDSLEECVDDRTITVTPDVIFEGVENGKPRIEYSKHLVDDQKLSLVLVESSIYPETAALLCALRNFDQFRRRLLREAYLIIGDTQREFFETFEPSALNVLSQENLAFKVGVSPGTISRAFSNRYVQARDVNRREVCFPSKELLVTRHGLLLFMVIPKLNQIFEDEFSSKTAFSDERIRVKLKPMKIARRTIQSYRDYFGIPKSYVRDCVYSTDERTEPYRMVLDFLK